jgi:drug/metabolite transporter (DMT)-like permease
MSGIVLSMAGIALVVLVRAHGQQKHASLSGDFFVLAGSLCWAISPVLLKPYTERVKGFQLSALTMVGGAIPLALAASPALAATHWSGVTTLGWAAIVYSGVGSLVVAYYFWYHGVRVLGPTRTAMYSNLQPVIAILVAWLLLSETPSVWQAIGAACIMSGLVLTRM